MGMVTTTAPRDGDDAGGHGDEREHGPFVDDRLAHAQRLGTLGQLTCGIVHDFNNLLGLILSSSELLLEELPDHDPRRRDAADVRYAALRAAELTKQLLAFGRQRPCPPAEIDATSVVRSVVQLLQRVISKNIVLQTETACGPARVIADPVQLEQVLLNLAINARDAMPDGGVLALGIRHAWVRRGSPRRPGAYVVLTVADTGCGMTAETCARIFEPFFTTKEGKGTGLGLATSYDIVKKLGGDILVTSEPGRGTTMEIYLPACPA